MPVWSGLRNRAGGLGPPPIGSRTPRPRSNYPGQAGGRILCLPSAGSLRWRIRAPRPCSVWLDPPDSENARCPWRACRGSRMPDESYVVREQARAAAQWEASCASDDALKRLIRAQLSEGRLGSVNGVSKSRRGTGRPLHRLPPHDRAHRDRARSGRPRGVLARPRGVLQALAGGVSCSSCRRPTRPAVGLCRRAHAQVAQR